MADVMALGEALIDLKLIDGSITMHTGGSVLNFSFYSEQAGAKTKLIGTVGHDFLSYHIEEELKSLKSNLRPIKIQNHNTTLVLIKEAGRNFIIYRDADRFLTPDIIAKEWEKSKIVHTSAFALSMEPANNSILETLIRAKEEGALISVDPNYRYATWKKWNAKKEILLKAISLADYVKPSIEDAKELFGVTTPREALKAFKNAGAKNIILSMNEKGVIALSEEKEIIRVPAKRVEVIDATGAGDSLFGTVMAKVSQGYSLKEAIEEGVEIAAKVVSQFGNLIRVG